MKLSEVCAEVWPGVDPDRARRSLQVHVSSLRTALAVLPARITARAGGYVLEVDDERVDARRFERLAADGRAELARDPERARALLTEALGVWRGEALGDLAGEPFAGAEVARRIVTLGSPLHGARIAGIGAALAPDACPQACRQLAPGSDVLDEIDAAPLPDGLPWLSIWTENDETVQPPESARLAGAVNVPLQGLCPGARVSHGELPTDPAVTALVLAGLGTAPLTAPAACPVSS